MWTQLFTNVQLTIFKYILRHRAQYSLLSIIFFLFFLLAGVSFTCAAVGLGSDISLKLQNKRTALPHENNETLDWTQVIELKKVRIEPTFYKKAAAEQRGHIRLTWSWLNCLNKLTFFKWQ